MYEESPTSGSLTNEIPPNLKLTKEGHLCIDGVVLDDDPVVFSDSIDVLQLDRTALRHAMVDYHLAGVIEFTKTELFEEGEHPFEGDDILLEVEEVGKALIRVFESSIDFGNHINFRKRDEGDLGNDTYNSFAEDAFAINTSYFLALHQELLTNINDPSGIVQDSDGLYTAIPQYLAYRLISLNNPSAETKMYAHGGVGSDQWNTLDTDFSKIEYDYSSDFFENGYDNQQKSELFSSVLYELARKLNFSEDNTLAILTFNSLAELNVENVYNQPDAAAMIFNTVLEYNYSPTDLCQIFTLFKSVYGSAFTQNVAYQENLLADCSKINSIPYHTYYDVNPNGQKDTEDFFLSDIKLNLGESTQYISQQYNQKILINAEGELVVSVDTESNPDWSLTSGASSYNITIDSTYVPDTLFFWFLSDSATDRG